MTFIYRNDKMHGYIRTQLKQTEEIAEAFLHYGQVFREDHLMCYRSDSIQFTDPIIGRIARRVLLMAVCMLCVFCFSGMTVRAASTGGVRKEVKLPDYKKVVRIRIDADDFNRSLKNALTLAAEKASSSRQYKIIIPKGTHICSMVFYVPSNTWIYANGAVLDFNRSSGEKAYMLTNWEAYGGKAVTKSQKNIRITGGTWDISGWPADSTWNKVSPVRFCNVRNLVIEKVRIKANRTQHLMEFADVTGLKITGCRISGNSATDGIQPKEAIQLDVAEEDAFPKCITNGKGCHNVVIEHNTFTDVARGVGSHNFVHSTTQNPSYTNVFICDNTFSKVYAEPIHVLHAKGMTISGNVIKSGKRAGIYLEDCSYTLISKNTIKKITAYSGDRGAAYGTFRSGTILAGCRYIDIVNNIMTGINSSGPYYSHGNPSSNITASGNKY